ncbi:MAG: TetR family transcriptional regulator C-terminal domain-containing protein [Bacteroidota bacterium]
MGMHSSLLVHYFHTKEELILSLVEYMMEQYQDHYLPEMAQLIAPRDRYEYMLQALFSAEWQELTESAVYYSCFALIFRHPRIRERFQANHQVLHDFLFQELSQAQAHGFIQVPSLEDAAHFLILLVEGLNHYDRLHQNKEMYAAQRNILYRMARNYLENGN